MAEVEAPDRGTLIVTGGGRGIGAAVCRQAARQGYRVCVNYLSRSDSAEALVNEIHHAGGRACVVQADTADPGAVERLFEAAAGTLGPVTGLVNNAGLTGPVSRLDEAEPETIRRVMAVNGTGALYCAREAVRRMSPRHGGGGGNIVTISSGAATLGSAGEYVWYAASKGAVDSMTIGLAKEVTGEGIRVNAVSPGLTDTDIHAESSQAPDRVDRLGPQIPMGRAARPEEVANAVCWLLSDEASYVSGAILRVGGGR